jgi:hypothetical protein
MACVTRRCCLARPWGHGSTPGEPFVNMTVTVRVTGSCADVVIVTLEVTALNKTGIYERQAFPAANNLIECEDVLQRATLHFVCEHFAACDEFTVANRAYYFESDNLQRYGLLKRRRSCGHPEEYVLANRGYSFDESDNLQRPGLLRGLRGRVIVLPEIEEDVFRPYSFASLDPLHSGLDVP